MSNVLDLHRCARTRNDGISGLPSKILRSSFQRREGRVHKRAYAPQKHRNQGQNQVFSSTMIQKSTFSTIVHKYSKKRRPRCGYIFCHFKLLFNCVNILKPGMSREGYRKITPPLPHERPEYEISKISLRLLGLLYLAGQMQLNTSVQVRYVRLCNIGQSCQVRVVRLGQVSQFR